MTLRNQGFELALDLSESVDDRQILNNIAGGNIQQDIALFRNNKRNTSTLVWQYGAAGAAITDNRFVFPPSVRFTFTSGDVVTLSGTSLGTSINALTTYYIVDFITGLGALRNQSAFGLALTSNGTRIAMTSQPTASVTFTRSDEVTRQNLFNIATPITLEQGLSRASSGLNDSFYYNIGPTFTAAFDTIDSNIDVANYLRTQKYTTNASIATYKPIIIEGSTISADPAAYNATTSAMSQALAPGVFITDPFSDVTNITKTRAYSTNSQPWTEDTGQMSTKSVQVNIGDLYFEQGIKLNGLTTVSSETGNVTDFTHKLPVKINGVDYFVLVKAV